MADQPAEAKKNRFDFSDVILGGQDGLVNVLGVILGVAAASQDPRLIVAAGLAATFAESISMGAVAYTSTVADSDYFRSEELRERREVETDPARKKETVAALYRAKGFDGTLLEQAVEKITANKELWIKTLMRDELDLQFVEKKVAFRSGLIVGVSALVGSFVPLMPFFFIKHSSQVGSAVWWSLGVAAAVLFLAGAYKAKRTVGHVGRSGLVLLLIGILSALAGYGIGLLFQAPTTP